jgi:hypothetical protein
MIKLAETPVVGNYDSFSQIKFDYGKQSLIPIFELEVEHLPSEDFIKNKINWDDFQSPNNSKRIPTFELSKEIQQELNPFLEQFSFDNIMKMLDELGKFNPNMFNYWGYDKSKPPSDFFSKALEVNIVLVKDKPNNEFSPHFDSRNTFGTMIVNLCDNEYATQFFDYSDVTPVIKQKVDMSLVDWEHRFDNLVIYETPKEKGKGMFFINCEETFHGVGIGAKAERERYAIFIMLQIKMN